MKDIKQLAKRGDPPNTLIYIYCKYIKMAVTENCTGMHVPYVLKTKSLENFEEIFHLKRNGGKLIEIHSILFIVYFT